MKYISILVAILLVMGIVLFPGCDEDSGNNTADLLVMKFESNSKYYLRFDVDYDNDAVVDEHVDMRVTHHFDYAGNGLDRYQAEFVGTNCFMWMALPRETDGPIGYDTADMPEFYFSFDVYRPGKTAYDMQTNQDFTFTITEWGWPHNTIRANFHGFLSDSMYDPTYIAQITNGELFARISDYYGD